MRTVGKGLAILTKYMHGIVPNSNLKTKLKFSKVKGAVNRSGYELTVRCNFILNKIKIKISRPNYITFWKTLQNFAFT